MSCQDRRSGHRSVKGMPCTGSVDAEVEFHRIALTTDWTRNTGKCTLQYTSFVFSALTPVIRCMLILISNDLIGYACGSAYTPL